MQSIVILSVTYAPCQIHAPFILRVIMLSVVVPPVSYVILYCGNFDLLYKCVPVLSEQCTTEIIYALTKYQVDKMTRHQLDFSYIVVKSSVQAPFNRNAMLNK
jgi:hypothetical protein